MTAFADNTPFRGSGQSEQDENDRQIGDWDWRDIYRTAIEEASDPDGAPVQSADVWPIVMDWIASGEAPPRADVSISGERRDDLVKVYVKAVSGVPERGRMAMATAWAEGILSKAKPHVPPVWMVVEAIIISRRQFTPEDIILTAEDFTVLGAAIADAGAEI